MSPLLSRFSPSERIPLQCTGSRPRNVSANVPSTKRGPAPAMQTHLFTPWLNPPGSSKQKNQIAKRLPIFEQCRGRPSPTNATGLVWVKSCPSARRRAETGADVANSVVVHQQPCICESSECRRTPAGRAALLVRS